MSFTNGGWSYNRFDEYDRMLAEKKSKMADKDYDGDGKVESSKDEYFGSKDKAIKKAMGKSTKEESKDDCECKEDVNENREMAYGGGKPGKGSGDGSKPKGLGGKGTYTMKGKDGKPLFKEESIEEGSCGSKGYQMGGTVGYQKGGEVKPKKKVVKEDVLEYMLENNMANNEVSAEVLFNHISDEFLESIEDDIMEAYQTMSSKATEMSKRRSRDLSDQEYKAAGTGDSKKTNDLMQKKIKVMDARGRHGAR